VIWSYSIADDHPVRLEAGGCQVSSIHVHLTISVSRSLVTD